MNPHLITFADLQAFTRYKRPSDVVRWLEERNIPYWPGAGGDPVTTIEAINSRLLPAGVQSADHQDTIDFDYAKKAHQSR